jgi:hypothetical protein
MKTSFINLILLALMASGLSSCKTSRKETWTQKETPWQKTQNHFAGNFKLGKEGMMVKTDKNGDEVENSDAQIGARDFNGSSTFKGGKRGVEKKAFDTKLFGGKGDVKKDAFHFVNEREQSRKMSALQQHEFSGANKETRDTKKSWFGRDKKVGSEGFFTKRKKNVVEGGAFYPTEKATEQNRGKQLPILQRPGEGTGAIGMDQIKEMLGRSTVVPAVVNDQSAF